jgi:hypothetical protein
MFGKVHSQNFSTKNVKLLRSTSHYSLSLYLRTGKLGVCTGHIIFSPPFFYAPAILSIWSTLILPTAN